MKQKNLATEILLTGLIAGLLDIAAAFVNTYFSAGKGPLVVLQFIASPLLGSDSFTMGYMSATLGLLLHFLIATAWTTLFYLLYPRWRFLGENKISAGVVYGVVVWLMMNLVVLKLAGLNKAPFQAQQVLTGILILIFCIGLPISFRAHRYYA